MPLRRELRYTVSSSRHVSRMHPLLNRVTVLLWSNTNGDRRGCGSSTGPPARAADTRDVLSEIGPPVGLESSGPAFAGVAVADAPMLARALFSFSATQAAVSTAREGRREPWPDHQAHAIWGRSVVAQGRRTVLSDSLAYAITAGSRKSGPSGLQPSRTIAAQPRIRSIYPLSGSRKARCTVTQDVAVGSRHYKNSSIVSRLERRMKLRRDFTDGGGLHRGGRG